jgi:hypothetical protein
MPHGERGPGTAAGNRTAHSGKPDATWPLVESEGVPARPAEEIPLTFAHARPRSLPDDAGAVARRSRPPAIAGGLPATVQTLPMSFARPADVLALQRRAGNRAVARMVADARGGRVGAEMAGAGARNDLAVARQASAHLAPVTIQRQQTVVMGNTYTRKVSGLDGDPAAMIKKIRRGSRGVRKKKFETIELDDNAVGHIRDAKGNVAWYRVRGSRELEYIAAKEVLAGISPPASFTAGYKQKDTDPFKGPGLDLASGAFAAADDPTLETVRRQELAKNQDTTGATPGASAGLLQAEGALWMGAGIFGMATGIRDLMDDDKNAWEKVNAALAVGTGIYSTMGAAAQIASTTYNSNSAQYAQSAGVGAWSLSFGEMLTGLAAGVKTIKAVVDLVRMTADDKKHGRDEWVLRSGELLANGLETAKGVLRSIRAVNEALAGGTVGSQFKEAFPGLDIAILAVKSIMQGYYLTVSAVNLHRMRKEKARLKEARERMSQHGRTVRGAGAIGGPWSQNLSADEQVDLVNSLKITNRKRVVRQAIHIGSNLVQVGSSIATYVSGPGAPAAIGLKAAAMGIDLSLPITRWIKQKGRDVAERNALSGKSGLPNRIFNADKSTSAKLAERKKQAVSLLRMVAGLNHFMGDPMKQQHLREHGQRVEMYLSASGVDTDALYAKNGNPAKQIEILVKALAARELGE